MVAYVSQFNSNPKNLDKRECSIQKRFTHCMFNALNNCINCEIKRPRWAIPRKIKLWKPTKEC